MGFAAWSGRLLRLVAPPFGVGLGVTVGGALLGGFGVFLVGRASPGYIEFAWRIRLWAVAAAIGGTMAAMEKLEQQLLGSGVEGVLRDVAVVGAAYWGADMGYLLVRWLVSA